MSDPQTTNRGLYQPVTGSNSGTWGTVVNANAGAMDSLAANVAAISLTSATTITLSTPPTSGTSWAGPYQSQSALIRFSGTLSGNSTINISAGFYIVENNCTVGTNYVLISAANATGICAPPGQQVHVFSDGTNVRYVNMPPVGTYLDYAGSSVPAWISNSTPNPYLNCDASTFSAVTYPQLNAILGTTTLPDFKGSVPAYLNQSSGRLTTAGGGVDGNTIFARGGVQTTVLAQGNLPNVNFNVTDPGHSHTPPSGASAFFGPAGTVSVSFSGPGGNSVNAFGATNTSTTSITVSSGGSATALSNLPPMTVGGIRLIRSA